MKKNKQFLRRNSEKRKSDSKLDNKSEDYSKEMKQFRIDAGQHIQEKKEQLKNTDKPKFSKFIYSRLADMTANKKKFVALEVKQKLEFNALLTYDAVVERVWENYLPTHAFTREDHNLLIVLGLEGPIVYNTKMLENNSSYYVCFQPKEESPIGAPSCSKNREKNVFQKFASSSKSLFTMGGGSKAKDVPPSTFPRITRSVIQHVAKPITKECEVKKGKLKRLLQNEQTMAWLPDSDIEFVVGRKLDSGTFRDAFSITVTKADIEIGQYVLKTWNKRSMDARREELGEGREDLELLEDMSKRAVQCQFAAKGIASAMRWVVGPEFGHTFRYISAYVLNYEKTSAMIEPFLSGRFIKYLNNDMKIVLQDGELGEKADSLAHFSHHYTGGKTLLTDLQGVGYQLTDPELSCASRYDEENNDLNFGVGNIEEAIANFRISHTCNRFCQMAKLKAFSVHLSS